MAINDTEKNMYVEESQLQGIKDDLKYIRRTARQLLGHIQSYPRQSAEPPFKELEKLEKFALAEVCLAVNRINSAYLHLDYENAYLEIQALTNFLSSFYLEVRRNHIVCNMSHCSSIIHILQQILMAYTVAISPIYPFTAHEIYALISHSKGLQTTPSGVFGEQWPTALNTYISNHYLAHSTERNALAILLELRTKIREEYSSLKKMLIIYIYIYRGIKTGLQTDIVFVVDDLNDEEVRILNTLDGDQGKNDHIFNYIRTGGFFYV